LAVAESATARRDYPTAVRHYQALLQSQPNNPIILNNVAWALGQLKDPKALDYSERANRIAPNQPAIMETLGTLLAEKGEVTRALEVLQKAVELAPQSPALKLSLARAQIKAGKKSEARKQLDELAKLGDKFAAQAEVAKLSKELAN
jgi:Tfp pilus assembly protein PilF